MQQKSHCQLNNNSNNVNKKEFHRKSLKISPRTLSFCRIRNVTLEAYERNYRNASVCSTERRLLGGAHMMPIFIAIMALTVTGRDVDECASCSPEYVSGRKPRRRGAVFYYQTGKWRQPLHSYKRKWRFHSILIRLTNWNIGLPGELAPVKVKAVVLTIRYRIAENDYNWRKNNGFSQRQPLGSYLRHRHYEVVRINIQTAAPCNVFHRFGSLRLNFLSNLEKIGGTAEILVQWESYRRYVGRLWRLQKIFFKRVREVRALLSQVYRDEIRLCWKIYRNFF